jgi:hypothetical protein
MRAPEVLHKLRTPPYKQRQHALTASRQDHPDMQIPPFGNKAAPLVLGAALVFWFCYFLLLKILMMSSKMALSSFGS